MMYERLKIVLMCLLSLFSSGRWAENPEGKHLKSWLWSANQRTWSTRWLERRLNCCPFIKLMLIFAYFMMFWDKRLHYAKQFHMVTDRIARPARLLPSSTSQSDESGMTHVDDKKSSSVSDDGFWNTFHHYTVVAFSYSRIHIHCISVNGHITFCATTFFQKPLIQNETFQV